jgi:hypothetical protein
MQVFEGGRGRNNNKNWLGKGIFELLALKKGGANRPTPMWERVKGAQVWDFPLLGFSPFLHHNVSMGDDFGVEIIYFFIFRGSLRVEKFLTHMLSLILKRIFSSLEKRCCFLWSFWDHLSMSKVIKH